MKARINDFRTLSLVLLLANTAAYSASRSPTADNPQAAPLAGHAADGSLACWFLMAGTQPGGPGQWVQLPSARCSTGRANRPVIGVISRPALHIFSLPVIRAGDQVQVEGHSSVADVCFRAQALGSGRLGETFRVRLVVGGAVVRVVAQSQGHASMIDAGGRP